MRYVEGDILAAPETHIAHGINSRGVMGAGVALALKRKWPVIFTDVREEVDKWDPARLDLGSVVVSYVEDDEVEGYRRVHSVVTQEGYGVDRRQVNYAALARGMIEVAMSTRYLHTNHSRVVAIPRIGAGLGGGDWAIVEPILVDVEAMSGAEFVVYDLPPRRQEP